MTLIPSNRIAALTVAALLSASPAALAQTAQTPGPAPAAPAAPATAAGKALPGGGAAVKVEARIKQLHTQLGITPAQEAQWQQFAQTMRDNAREMDQVVQQRAQQFSSMNALQDLQSYEQVAEAHVQHLQKLIPAFEQLYAAMSQEQKNRADEVFRARTENRAQSANGHSG